MKTCVDIASGGLDCSIYVWNPFFPGGAKRKKNLIRKRRMWDNNFHNRVLVLKCKNLTNNNNDNWICRHQNVIAFAVHSWMCAGVCYRWHPWCIYHDVVDLISASVSWRYPCVPPSQRMLKIGVGYGKIIYLAESNQHVCPVVSNSQSIRSYTTLLIFSSSNNSIHTPFSTRDLIFGTLKIIVKGFYFLVITVWGWTEAGGLEWCSEVQVLC